jgi:DMATS type aromatic prenyltransferase
MNGHAPVGRAAPMPWNALGNVLGFENEDQEFWWTSLAPVLGKFLVKADYEVSQQFAFLSWFHKFIIPAFGPRPEEGKERLWRTQVTPTGAPFQPSWNLQNGKSTVRFTIEPTGAQAGTREDCFNQVAAFDLMKKLKTTMPNLEDSWFYHCAKELYVPKDLINIMLLVKGPPKGPRPPTCFLAFDLLKNDIETKAYFFPHIRAFQLGITQGELIINTVKGLNGNGIDMNPGLAVLENYLASGGPVSLKNCEMLAIDCVEPSRARAKIYVNSYNNSFNKIKDIYTMGGRITDKAILKSLGPLKELWRLLFNMPETGFEDIELPNIMHHRACFVFGFEFKSGSPTPVTKIYFPLWHFCQNDAQISTALSGFFAKQKWQKLSDSYANDVAEIL